MVQIWSWNRNRNHNFFKSRNRNQNFSKVETGTGTVKNSYASTTLKKSNKFACSAEFFLVISTFRKQQNILRIAFTVNKVRPLGKTYNSLEDSRERFNYFNRYLYQIIYDYILTLPTDSLDIFYNLDIDPSHVIGKDNLPYLGYVIR